MNRHSDGPQQTVALSRDSRTNQRPLVLCLGFFVFSSGTVLFSLAIFRLLSFFIMPSMFFDLLLVGFPIGAAIAVRCVGSELKDLRRLLSVLQLVMAITVVLTLLCKHVGYMRAQLFGISPLWILAQISVFSVISVVRTSQQ